MEDTKKELKKNIREEVEKNLERNGIYFGDKITNLVNRITKIIDKTVFDSPVVICGCPICDTINYMKLIECEGLTFQVKKEDRLFVGIKCGSCENVIPYMLKKEDV